MARVVDDHKTTDGGNTVGCCQFQSQEGASGFRAIFQESEWIFEMADRQIEVTIVVEIPSRGCSAQQTPLEIRPACGGNVNEISGTFILQ